MFLRRKPEATILIKQTTPVMDENDNRLKNLPFKSIKNGSSPVYSPAQSENWPPIISSENDEDRMRKANDPFWMRRIQSSLHLGNPIFHIHLKWNFFMVFFLNYVFVYLNKILYFIVTILKKNNYWIFFKEGTTKRNSWRKDLQTQK